jgi:hypothetical protein
MAKISARNSFICKRTLLLDFGIFKIQNPKEIRKSEKNPKIQKKSENPKKIRKSKIRRVPLVVACG